MTGASAHRGTWAVLLSTMATIRYHPVARCAKKVFSCATMPLPRPRMIASNPLEGEIGALQRAISKGCFLAYAVHRPIGDTPFRFFPILFLRRRSSTGTDLTRSSRESPPVFERNDTMRDLPPIRDQHAYFQMSGLP